MLVVAVPSLASGAEQSVDAAGVAAANARISAHDDGGRFWWQDASSASDADADVTISVGEQVTFDFPVGNGTNVHNVSFRGAPAPTSCPQTKAAPGLPVDSDDVPPMPASAQPAGWEGYCTFTTPGTYSFVCG